MEARMPCVIDEHGIPVVPEAFSECYEVCLRGVKETNRHHLFYPRREYRGFPDRQARETGSMIVNACVCKHSDYHSTYLPPKKPDRHTLCDIAQGDFQPSTQPVFIRSKERTNMENTA